MLRRAGESRGCPATVVGGGREVAAVGGLSAIVRVLLGAAIALALTPFAPAGVPIIAAGAACLIGLKR